jgi:tungstate transport system substrate-binding protein
MNIKPRCYRLYLILAVAITGLLLLLPALLSGCGGDDTPLVFAAANDLEGSGVLQAWTEDFQSRTGRRVELVIVPDEQALDMARHGECDLMLTHVPDEEEELERPGYLEGSQEVMRGDFVILGPPADPAGIRGMESAVDAFEKIAETMQTFILRFDGSGTAIRQSLLWAVSDAGATGEWLLPTEGDAEEAIRETSREGAYTLADRSSYERLAGELDLEILLEGDEALEDIYSAAAVSTLTYPDTDLDGALEFIDYLLSEDARRFFNLGAWGPP